MKAVGVAPLPRPTAAIDERLLTGEAFALAEVEFVMLVGAAGVGVEPLVALVDVLPGDVPLIFFVASLTSWNFSINYSMETFQCLANICHSITSESKTIFQFLTIHMYARNFGDLINLVIADMRNDGDV